MAKTGSKDAGHKKKRPPYIGTPRGRVATRYRAYPSSEQFVLIKRFGGSVRYIKNRAKEQRDKAWEGQHKRISYTKQSKWVLAYRKGPEAPWLAEVPAQVLQQAVRDTDGAYKAFLEGRAGYPDWQRRSGWYSFRDPQGAKYRRTSKCWGEVKVQGLGWVRVRHHRPLVGKSVKSATVVMEPDGKVFVSILTDKHKRAPTKPKVAGVGTVVGVDRGVAVAVATHDGEGNEELVDREMWRPKERERLKRLEQARERKKLARKKQAELDNAKRSKAGLEPLAAVRKSKNQEKVEAKIAGLHARARRRRKDFVEQQSCSQARGHRAVVFEDLHIPAMTASARGTKEHPGKNVKQKAGLNRAILDKGWGALKTRTEQKALRHGHACLSVPAPYTSVTCPECGLVDKANRASRSMLVCLGCGYKAHADLNAAREIRERGIIELVLAGGTPVAAHPGTNRGPGQGLAQSRSCTGRRGSGNEKTGTSTDRGAA